MTGVANLYLKLRILSHVRMSQHIMIEVYLFLHALNTYVFDVQSTFCMHLRRAQMFSSIIFAHKRNLYLNFKNRTHYSTLKSTQNEFKFKYKFSNIINNKPQS